MFSSFEKEAQELGWKGKDLNPIFISLSQTYMDLRDFKNAIVNYKKELEQYSDIPSEVFFLDFPFLNIFFYTGMYLQACRTILNIANALEEDGASYYELEPLYDEAVALAEKARDCHVNLWSKTHSIRKNTSTDSSSTN